MADPEPSTDEVDSDSEVIDPEQDAINSAADDAQARLWIRCLTPLLQLRSHDTDPSGRVQFAFDQMYVAACERVARILRADLGA
jgi:hypothetical protein